MFKNFLDGLHGNVSRVTIVSGPPKVAIFVLLGKLARLLGNPIRCNYGRMEPQHALLGQEAIEEFKAMYESEFGETLSDEHARTIAMRVIRFFYILAQHAPSLTEEITVR